MNEMANLFMKQSSAVLLCFCLVGGFMHLSYCDYKTGLLQTNKEVKKERKNFRHIRF